MQRAVFFHFIDSIFSFSLGIVLTPYWLVYHLGCCHTWDLHILPRIPTEFRRFYIGRTSVPMHNEFVFFNFFKEPFAHYQKPCQFLVPQEGFEPSLKVPWTLVLSITPLGHLCVRWDLNPGPPD